MATTTIFQPAGTACAICTYVAETDAEVFTQSFSDLDGAVKIMRPCCIWCDEAAQSPNETTAYGLTH